MSLMLCSILYILSFNSYFPRLMSPYVTSICCRSSGFRLVSGFCRLLDFLEDFMRVDFILEILLFISAQKNGS